MNFKIKLLRNRRGSLLINSVILMFVLILTGGAFLKWTTQAAHQAIFDLASSQAYYVAQYGAINGGLAELRRRTDIDLPNRAITFPNGEIDSDIGGINGLDFTGKYIDNVLEPVPSFRLDPNAPDAQDAPPEQYFVHSTGVVDVVMVNGEHKSVSRTVTLKVQKPALSKYFYFTDQETTALGEVIWFYQEDIVYGPVRSNDVIAIKNNPQFYSEVITTASDFLHGPGFNPIFHGPDPQFDADSVVLEDRAGELRQAASGMGNYFDSNDGEYQSRVVAEPGGWHVQQWPAGSPFDETTLVTDIIVPYTLNTAIFCEGPLQLWGDNVQGRSTVGSEGDMRLMDDVTYQGYGPADLSTRNQEDSYYLANQGSSDILGLISEQNIRIANTPANGRGNHAALYSTNHDSTHIIITGALITLGGSFDFENQNNAPDDPFGFDGYWWCDPQGQHPNQPDERGEIWLRGSVIQRRRGYVHRSNCGGTGYDKEYSYDIRMWKTPPPYFPKETDKDGRYNFQIVQSFDSIPQGAQN